MEKMVRMCKKCRSGAEVDRAARDGRARHVAQVTFVHLRFDDKIAALASTIPSSLESLCCP